MKLRTTRWLACVALLLLGQPAEAQIELRRSVVGSGGGVGGSAGKSLNGTVGQAAAGIVTGSGLIHEIGFWLMPTTPTGVDELPALPTVFSLEQNHPNPFNPVTTIRYAVPEQTRVTIVLFDIRGRHVESLLDSDHDPGYFDLRFDASLVPSGVYFYRLQAGDYAETKKMILLK